MGRSKKKDKKIGTFKCPNPDYGKGKKEDRKNNKQENKDI